MLKTRDFNHEVQLLSFLVIREAGDSYISTCIHLHIDGYGKSAEEANQDMFENVYNFLNTTFKELEPVAVWKNLDDLFMSDNWSCELGDAYHKVQIQLSIQGISTIKTSSHEKMTRH